MLADWVGKLAGCASWLYTDTSRSGELRVASEHIDGLVQDCCISIPLAMEILQSCTKPSIWSFDDVLKDTSFKELYGLLILILIIMWFVPQHIGPQEIWLKFYKLINFKLLSRINILSFSCEIVIRWMPQDLTDDKSALVQVMAWCCQATSHYLGQCWPRFPSPHGVTRLQWVKM